MSVLMYDLSLSSSCVMVRNHGGETVRKEYSLPNGEVVSISRQADAAGHCIGAEATINNRVLARAEVLRMDFNAVELHEVHFAPDGPERVIYVARSKFGGFRRKTEELRVEGQKVYELFPDFRWR